MSRQRAKIDKKNFESLCALQCTQAEICDFFDVTDKTLTRWCKDTYEKSFSDVFRVKRGLGKASLRRTQWRLAETSTAMAIFLGKNYLGQSDRIENTIVYNDDKVVEDLYAELKGTTEFNTTDEE